MNSIDLTEEQTEAIEDDSEIKVLNAVAGSGKTTVLFEIMLKMKKEYILTLCFNKSIKDELKERVNGINNVECYTFHGLAYDYFRHHSNKIVEFNKRDIIDEFDIHLIESFFNHLKINNHFDKDFFLGFKLKLESFLQSDSKFEDFFKEVENSKEYE